MSRIEHPDEVARRRALATFMNATIDAHHAYLACRAEYIRAAKRYIGADPNVPVVGAYETDELTLLFRPYISLWQRDNEGDVLLASTTPITRQLRPGPGRAGA